MLKFLHIENIAVIKNLDLSLEGGLNVFTGQTGAGKSMIIDSLSFLCGARGDRTMIREQRAVVEGVLSLRTPDFRRCLRKTASRRRMNCLSPAP